MPARRKSVATAPAGEQLEVLGLGSNLGARLENLRRAARDIAQIPGVSRVASSRLYQTPPAGGPAQPDYLNAAVLVRAAVPPEELLEAILAIERRRGRTRPDPIRWGPRIIDIDWLWSSAGAIALPGLTVPHPRLAERTFAVQPLVDLLPDARDPLTGAAYAELPAAGAAIACVGRL